MKEGISIGKTGFIVQARMGSTRLPGKVMLAFDGSDKLIGIIAGRIMKSGGGLPIVVATTEEPEDDVLCQELMSLEIPYFRGSAEDVLSRFIASAESLHFGTIIRICADNPFIDIPGTMRLLDEHFRGGNDYTAYSMAPGLPSIKSHIGLWGEVVSLKALRRARDLTAEKLYREHVTNYIYSNPGLFNVHLLPAPAPFFGRNDIRLTLDDPEDYTLILKLLSYSDTDIINFESGELFNIISMHPEIKEKMVSQISKYQK
jgi:spore coat polysaccharide biosynthesis protein SpsF